MYKLLTSKGQLFGLILGLVVIAVYLFSVIGGLSSAGYGISDDLNSIMKSNADADFSFFEMPLMLVACMVGAAFVLAVLFGLKNLISSPKGSIKAIIAFAVILILFFILYTTSVAESSGKIGELVQRFDVNETASKLISGGIKTVGILAAGAVVIMVVSELRNLFK